MSTVTRTGGKISTIMPYSHIARELKAHAPFTVFGVLTGIALMVALIVLRAPVALSRSLFWTLHPVHVFLSAATTAAMYRLHSKGGFVKTALIGYFGAIGIATLSDCLLPYIAEWALQLPNRHMHIGFIEKWWLVNPLAGAGIVFACYRPSTRFPHAGHVLLSTWASLFHITMASGMDMGAPVFLVVGGVLFVSVVVPCCMSDIVFPLLFTGWPRGGQAVIPESDDQM